MRAVRSNLLENWASYCDAQTHYKRDIEAAKRIRWRNLVGHLKEVGPAAKFFQILAGSGEAIDCLLDSVYPMGGQDFGPTTQRPSGTHSLASAG